MEAEASESSSDEPEKPPTSQPTQSDATSSVESADTKAEEPRASWPAEEAESDEDADEAQAARPSWPTETAQTAEPSAPSQDAAEGGHDRLSWPSAEPPTPPETAPPEEPTDSSAEKTSVFRAVVKPPTSPEPTRPEKDVEPPGRPPASEGATSVFRPVTEPTRPDKPASDGATSVFRPVERQHGPRTDAPTSRPIGQRPGQDQNKTVGLFRPPRKPQSPQNLQGPKPPVDGPTVNYLRPVQPTQRPDNPPSFVRPRQPAPTDTAPGNLRPERHSDWPPPEPPRATPQRIGPHPDEPPTRRKSKKPLLIAAISIVAVIGIAAGVVFGVPGLAQKLGLSSEEAVAVAPPPGPITYTPGLHGPASSAPTPTKQGVEQALAGPIANPALGTITGVVLDPATGQALYERDAGRAITPASTGKLVTAAAALLSIDHTQQLVTKVVEGDSPGEVIIVGGGDPTISSLKPGDDSSIYKGAAHLSDLVDQVKASGVQVNTVYIDQSRYAAPHMAPSWLPEDVGNGYIAPIVPAMLDGDRRDATQNYSPRSNDPGRTLVNEFARRIGATPASNIDKKAGANAKVLGEIRSAPLSQLVDNMLDHSENTLGDVLAHEVAIKAGQEPTFDGAAKAMLDILKQNGFDTDGVVLKDGSGMSTENKVSAKLLAQLLSVAAGPDGKDKRTAKLRPLLGGLPVAGGSGTLEDRYNQGASTEGRGWVRAKTGTLTGVNSLAGIVMDKDNRPLVFAFLTSGTNGSTARPALDTVASALRGCGCV